MYRVAHKKRPKLCTDVVLLSNRIKQQEITLLNSNHSWTVWEIMTLYAFVLIVKYTKEYWVSETYKITNKFNTSHSLHEIESQRLAENVTNHASILLSNRIQSFLADR